MDPCMYFIEKWLDDLLEILEVAHFFVQCCYLKCAISSETARYPSAFLMKK